MEENIVNDSEVKVEGGYALVFVMTTKSESGGRGEPRQSRDAGKHCGRNTTPLPLILPPDPLGKFRLVLLSWTPCLGGQRWNLCAFCSRELVSPLLSRGWLNGLSHVGCLNVFLQSALYTVCVGSQQGLVTSCVSLVRWLVLRNVSRAGAGCKRQSFVHLLCPSKHEPTASVE